MIFTPITKEASTYGLGTIISNDQYKQVCQSKYVFL